MDKGGESWEAVRNDSTLPQEDINSKQRIEELARKKMIYQLEKKFDGKLAIPMVREMPAEQDFSKKYFVNVLAKRSIIHSIEAMAINLTTECWETLDDIGNVYSETLPVPSGFNNWRSDKEFAAQRLTGCNPNQIQLCEDIPSNFDVNDEMLKPLMEELTIQEATEQKRLFIVNYTMLENLSTDMRTNGALFVDKFQTLMPVAIQLYQEPARENPVFLPTDPTYTWMLAKMWFNNADGAYHQAISHLGFTHLIAETIAVAANRCLSPSHPIFKLLAPHCLYVMALNKVAITALINPGGQVDKAINLGHVGFLELTDRVFRIWRLDVEGNLPADLRNRELDNPDVLPGYHYRDDAILLHGAIKEYVEFVVNKRYHSTELLPGDNEIQDFADTLVRPTDEGGCGIKGVAGNGMFTTNSQLIDVLTSIIFISSVGHAAANFNQYDEYGFPPNAPLSLKGKPPTDKSPLTEQDILDRLPDKKSTLDIMVLTLVLSERATQRLGNFEKLYQTDPVGREAVKRFQDKLSSVGKIIRSRDAKRNPHYPYLDPREVPNAISI